ncbi:hypothetical protein EYZ11_011304 [Aspergillus tanneri]|uniref:O-methyltransferase C-terminal domain-containing protein n=1 Tax=Aspergillus tanneri TaxID=1220188 RepID=A0A4S3J5A5_9EURO|nr:hypothetical protein EYZ11_011304 [Aspergillus tanneri]
MPKPECLHTDYISILVEQVTQEATAFLNGGGEGDRIKALKSVQNLMNALLKPQDSVYHLAYSPTHTICVRVGIDLGIFETLTENDRPVTLAELAAVKGADLILTGIGYVQEHDTRIYIATTMTRQMTDSSSIAMVKVIFDLGMPILAKVPEFLRHNGFRNPSPTSGPLQYVEKSASFWDFLSQKSEYFDVFNTFMEGDRGSRPSWLAWFPVQERLIDGFEQGNECILLVDVAGGRGHDISAFLNTFPEAPGRLVLEDKPQVIDELRGLDGRIERVAFDLFKPQPIRGARIYYMKFVLHDWPDDECRVILGYIREAMKCKYSKLVIEEFILPNKDCAMISAMWDWEMLIFCSSMERTVDHWKMLLASAGFGLLKFWYPPGDGQGIIEAELE